MDGTSVVQYLRQLVAQCDAPSEADSQLLEPFVADRDQAAFARIVHRHGPLVWGVCRRLLRDSHLAEDAFQATFLVLVYKAGSIGRRELLSNWLYGVAWRTAHRARATQRRRQTLEQGMVEDIVAPAETCDANGMDDQIAALPAKYRQVLILCYLDGNTYEQAAEYLGIPKGTVSVRLARARAMLRERLRRRGVTMASVVPGSAVPASAAIAAVANAMCATGVVSPMVLALARGVIKSMMMTKLTTVGTWVGVTAVVALGATAIAAKGDPTPPRQSEVQAVADKPDAKPEQAKPVTYTRTVSGTARDGGGKPVANAAIHLMSVLVPYVGSDKGKGEDKWVATTTANADGTFTFRDIALPALHVGSAGEVMSRIQLVGTASGFGVTWTDCRIVYNVARQVNVADTTITYLGEPLDFALSFRRSATIRGQVADDAGKPVAGINVHLRIGAYIEHMRNQMQFQHRFMWSLSLVPQWKAARLTDAEGRFEFDGLPEGAMFYTLLSHPNFANNSVYLATTDGPLPDDLGRLAHHVVSPEIMTGDIKLTMGRVKLVRLRVIAADTGKAFSGVSVDAFATNQTQISSHGKSNSQGDLELRLPVGEFTLDIRPPTDTDYVQTFAKLAVGAAAEQTDEVRVRPGCVANFEVIDADTGAGIPKIQFMMDHPNYSWYRIDRSTHRGDDALERTDAQGRFRAVMKPGTHEVRIGGRFENLMPLPPTGWEVVPDKDDPMEKTPGAKTIELIEGKSVTIRFKLRKSG
jgi:RNA polymerase sigma factor (sigma-70 family)